MGIGAAQVVDVQRHARVVDEALEELDHEIDVAGAFSLRTELRGRLVGDLTITLHGIPSMSFTVRRGLLDNYLLIRHRDGSTLAATTIDPTPVADVLATIAQLLRHMRDDWPAEASPASPVAE